MLKVKCINNHGEVKTFEIPKMAPYMYEIYLYRFLTTPIALNLAKDINPQFDKIAADILTNTEENVKCEFTYTIDKPKVLSLNFSLPLEAALFLGLDVGLDTCHATIFYYNEYSISGQDFIDSKQISTLLSHFNRTMDHINIEKKKLEVHFNSVDVELKECYKYMIEAAFEGKDRVYINKRICTERLAQKLKEAHFDVKEYRNRVNHFCGYYIGWNKKKE